MNTSILKTLSFSFVALFAASVAPAAQQNGVAHLAGRSAEAASVGCASQADIDRGWDYQIELVEARLAAKAQQPPAPIPGTIVTPPFAKLAPYRTDLPEARSAGKTAKSSVRAEGDSQR